MNRTHHYVSWTRWSSTEHIVSVIVIQMTCNLSARGVCREKEEENEKEEEEEEEEG